MDDLKLMKHAGQYLQKLSQGVNPITGKAVEGELEEVRLQKCFCYVSGILDEIVANGGQYSLKKEEV